MRSNKERKYSYQDCWNYTLSLQEDINAEEIKNDLIALCQTIPENFWLNFASKTLSNFDYSTFCHNLDKYIKKNYPVPYLTNKVSFYGLSFYLKEGIFIPQKDTEILVEKTLKLADKYWERSKNLKVLDIGTGCGSIVISLAKNRPEWNLVAVDINKKALEITKINAKFCQVENIQFIQSDLFENVDRKEKFDIIVSNPPYISNADYEKLAPSTKEQPKEALVAENDGYFFYQKIFQQSCDYLAKKFLLVVEVGHGQAEKVIKLIIEYFPRAKVSIYSDYAGHSRVIMVASS